VVDATIQFTRGMTHPEVIVKDMLPAREVRNFVADQYIDHDFLQGAGRRGPFTAF
jgi:hypothetical protein